jgi:hypothetical protein
MVYGFYGLWFYVSLFLYVFMVYMAKVPRTAVALPLHSVHTCKCRSTSWLAVRSFFPSVVVKGIVAMDEFFKEAAIMESQLADHTAARGTSSSSRSLAAMWLGSDEESTDEQIAPAWQGNNAVPKTPPGPPPIMASLPKTQPCPPPIMLTAQAKWGIGHAPPAADPFDNDQGAGDDDAAVEDWQDDAAGDWAADAADAEMAPASRQFDEETTVSHIMGTRWQDRGPTWTGNTAELWKRQKFRPLSQRWGNRGGGSRTWYAVFHRALRAGKSDAEAAVIANAEVGPRPPKP